jgi:hypothetical protein
MAFFIAQLAGTSKDTLSVAKLPCHSALESLELLVRWVMKNALLAPPSLGGRTSKRFSSP